LITPFQVSDKLAARRWAYGKTGYFQAALGVNHRQAKRLPDINLTSLTSLTVTSGRRAKVLAAFPDFD
jgi:hypothetical protein